MNDFDISDEEIASVMESEANVTSSTEATEATAPTEADSTAPTEADSTAPTDFDISDEEIADFKSYAQGKADEHKRALLQADTTEDKDTANNRLKIDNDTIRVSGDEAFKQGRYKDDPNDSGELSSIAPDIEELRQLKAIPNPTDKDIARTRYLEARMKTRAESLAMQTKIDKNKEGWWEATKQLASDTITNVDRVRGDLFGYDSDKQKARDMGDWRTEVNQGIVDFLAVDEDDEKKIFNTDKTTNKVYEKYGAKAIADELVTPESLSLIDSIADDKFEIMGNHHSKEVKQNYINELRANGTETPKARDMLLQETVRATARRDGISIGEAIKKTKASPRVQGLFIKDWKAKVDENGHRRFTDKQIDERLNLAEGTTENLTWTAQMKNSLIDKNFGSLEIGFDKFRDELATNTFKSHESDDDNIFEKAYRNTIEKPLTSLLKQSEEDYQEGLIDKKELERARYLEKVFKGEAVQYQENGEETIDNMNFGSLAGDGAYEITRAMLTGGIVGKSASLAVKTLADLGTDIGSEFFKYKEHNDMARLLTGIAYGGLSTSVGGTFAHNTRGSTVNNLGARKMFENATPEQLAGLEESLKWLSKAGIKQNLESTLNPKGINNVISKWGKGKTASQIEEMSQQLNKNESAIIGVVNDQLNKLGLSPDDMLHIIKKERGELTDDMVMGDMLKDRMVETKAKYRAYENDLYNNLKNTDVDDFGNINQYDITDIKDKFFRDIAEDDSVAFNVINREMNFQDKIHNVVNKKVKDEVKQAEKDLSFITKKHDSIVQRQEELMTTQVVRQEQLRKLKAESPNGRSADIDKLQKEVNAINAEQVKLGRKKGSLGLALKSKNKKLDDLLDSVEEVGSPIAKSIQNDIDSILEKRTKLNTQLEANKMKRGGAKAKVEKLKTKLAKATPKEKRIIEKDIKRLERKIATFDANGSAYQAKYEMLNDKALKARERLTKANKADETLKSPNTMSLDNMRRLKSKINEKLYAPNIGMSTNTDAHKAVLRRYASVIDNKMEQIANKGNPKARHYVDSYKKASSLAKERFENFGKDSNIEGMYKAMQDKNPQKMLELLRDKTNGTSNIIELKKMLGAEDDLFKSMTAKIMQDKIMNGVAKGGENFNMNNINWATLVSNLKSNSTKELLQASLGKEKGDKLLGGLKALAEHQNIISPKIAEATGIVKADAEDIGVLKFIPQMIKEVGYTALDKLNPTYATKMNWFNKSIDTDYLRREAKDRLKALESKKTKQDSFNVGSGKSTDKLDTLMKADGTTIADTIEGTPQSMSAKISKALGKKISKKLGIEDRFQGVINPVHNWRSAGLLPFTKGVRGESARESVTESYHDAVDYIKTYLGDDERASEAVSAKEGEIIEHNGTKYVKMGPDSFIPLSNLIH